MLLTRIIFSWILKLCYSNLSNIYMSHKYRYYTWKVVCYNHSVISMFNNDKLR